MRSKTLLPIFGKLAETISKSTFSTDFVPTDFNHKPKTFFEKKATFKPTGKQTSFEWKKGLDSTSLDETVSKPNGYKTKPTTSKPSTDRTKQKRSKPSTSDHLKATQLIFQGIFDAILGKEIPKDKVWNCKNRAELHKKIDSKEIQLVSYYLDEAGVPLTKEQMKLFIEQESTKLKGGIERSAIDLAYEKLIADGFDREAANKSIEFVVQYQIIKSAYDEYADIVYSPSEKEKYHHPRNYIDSETIIQARENFIKIVDTHFPNISTDIRKILVQNLKYFSKAERDPSEAKWREQEFLAISILIQDNINMLIATDKVGAVAHTIYGALKAAVSTHPTTGSEDVMSEGVDIERTTSEETEKVKLKPKNDMMQSKLMHHLFARGTQEVVIELEEKSESDKSSVSCTIL